MTEACFENGTEVEVSSKDEGLKNAWFLATVINSPSKSTSKKKKQLYVEYLSLVEEEGGSKPLREYVDVSHVRPRPPVLPDHYFTLNDMVNAYHNDGWWKGVITKVFDNSRFSVFFETSNEEIEFGKSDLRVHMEWTNGEWIQPENQAGNTAQASEMSSTKRENPNAASDEAQQKQPSVINLRKKTTVQSIPHKRKSPCNAANYSNLQQDSEPLRPERKLRKEETAKSPPLRAYVRSAISTRAKAKPVATPPMESKGSRPPRKLLFDDQPPMKIGSADQEKQPAGLSLAESPLNPSPGCSGDNPRPTNLGREEQPEIVTDQKKVEEKGKEIMGVPKKRGRPPKKQLANRRASVEDKEPNASGEEGHIVQNIDATECNEMSVTPALEGRLGQDPASGQEKVDEVTKAQLVSKEADISTNSTNILEEQPLWIEQFYGPCDGSGAMPDNQPVSQAGGAITSTMAPISNNVLVEHQTLPFVKRSPIWEAIESQNIFRLLPQKPHFRPLDQCKEKAREGQAIGHMVTFYNLVQETSILKLDNPRSDFEKILDALVDLDTYGFSVNPVIEWVNELLKIRDRRGQLVDESKATESEINKWRDENETLDGNISKMEETLCISRAQKERNESSINVSQMKLDRINKDIQDADVDFDRKVKPPWSDQS